MTWFYVVSRRVMVGWFGEVCRRRGLKVSTGKSKVMVLNVEEGLEYEVHVDGICLEHVCEFKYLGGVFWTNQVPMGLNAVGWLRAGGGLQVP